MVQDVCKCIGQHFEFLNRTITQGAAFFLWKYIFPTKKIFFEFQPFYGPKIGQVFMKNGKIYY